MQVPPNGTGQPGPASRSDSLAANGGQFMHGPDSPIARHRAAARGGGLIRALAWFSIGIGLTQVFAPRSIARTTGVSNHPVLMRMLGLREIAAGIGILRQQKPSGWLWARVAGDAMDLAMLGIAALSPRNRRGRVAASAAAVAGMAALDIAAGMRHGERSVERSPSHGRPAP